MKKENITIGFSVGDINGIGIEVILKALSDNRILDHITPVIYGSSKVLNFYKNLISPTSIHLHKIKNINQLALNKINVISLWDEHIDVNPGKSCTDGGKFAFQSLEAVTNDLASAKIDVLVTAPINKKNIQSDQFTFPGHTEYLTSLSNADDSLMLMVHEKLKIGIATNHLPLSNISNTLKKDLILDKINLMNNSLQCDFGITKPKIAILGLNPHAGENGMLGVEEKEIISPAIELAKSKNLYAFGPFPADGFFGSGNYHHFDGVLAMYHDQGLIPFKTIASGNGVNFTAGLPIIRTSPDHGTGFDIAGKNIAQCNSLRNAIYLAVYIHENRIIHKSISSDPLQLN